MSNHTDDNRRIAHNTLFLYIRMGVVMIISLYTTRVILRALGVEDYGIYNVVGGFVSMFNVLNSTLTSGINRFYNYELGKKEGGNITNVFNAAVIIQLFTAILLLVLIESIGMWYVNHVMTIPSERIYVANWLFQFSVFSMILIILQAPYSAAVLAYEKMDFFAFISILDAFLKLAICFLIQHLGKDKLLTYGALMLGISFLNFGLYFLFVRIKLKKLKLKKHLDIHLFKSMLSFSGWFMLDPIAYTVRGQGCNMVLNFFGGPILNAAHGIANQVSYAVDQMSGNFSVSFRPQIIQSYSSGEYSRTKRLMFSMSKISFLLHAMFSIPIIFEINNLLTLWLGKESIPEYAASFTCWIIVIRWINSLNPPITNVMLATGRIRIINICTACIVVSILPIAIIMMNMGLSPTSIYIIMLALTLVNQYVCVRILCNTFKEVVMKDYVKEIVIPCLVLSTVSLILPTVTYLLLQPSLGRLILTCCISVISVLTSTTFYLNDGEKKLARNLVVSMLKRIHMFK